MRPDPAEGPVAVVGASSDRSKFGNKAVRAYLAEGFTVWPVNPSEARVEGVAAFCSVDDLPDVPGIATLYLREGPALQTLDALARLQERKGRRVKALFLNPGVGTKAVWARAEELGFTARDECSIRAIGRAPAEFAVE
jgi:predicted CoA-binding protein